MNRATRTTVAACAMALCTLGLWSQVHPARAQEKAPPVASFAPGSVDFGDSVAKEASAPVRITVTNSGEGDLYLNSVAIEGENREDFAIAGDTCTGATIKPGKSCVVDVVITPSVTGPRRAGLTFTYQGGAQTVALSGNGINSAAVPPR